MTQNYFVKDSNPDWKQACTLEEWAIQMFREGRTEEPEFQAAVKLWGRPKFEGFWKRYCEEMNVKSKKLNHDAENSSRAAPAKSGPDR